MENNDFKDVVLNRSSVKEFDKKRQIDHEEMLAMIQEATKAPSSVNMQPWRFVVVESQEGKDLLHPLVRFNTRQNATSAAMVVIFGDLKFHEKAEEIYSRSVEMGYMPEQVKNDILGMFMPEYEKATKEQMKEMAIIDSSLVAMQFMLVARAHGYDTNPIGGFERKEVTETLGLDPEQFYPVIMIAIGKADYETHPSMRFDAQEITTFK